jgi:CBS domain-containing protein
MTVRAILDSKGHQILSVEPEAKLAAAVKILGERKIGAVLVMNQGRLEGILSCACSVSAAPGCSMSRSARS